MKMGAGVFWGGVLILIGLSLIIRFVFNIDFPIFKVIFAGFFIYLGIRILFGSFGHVGNFGHSGSFSCPRINSGPNDVLFSEKVFVDPENNKEYSVVFGKGTYDFTGIDLSKGNVNVKLNTVFGGTVIKVDRDTPLKINADAVFAGAELPDGNTAVFGSSAYQSENFDENRPHLKIKLDVVFGGVQVIRL